jgi:hypothetical protein
VPGEPTQLGDDLISVVATIDNAVREELRSRNG